MDMASPHRTGLADFSHPALHHLFAFRAVTLQQMDYARLRDGMAGTVDLEGLLAAPPWYAAAAIEQPPNHPEREPVEPINRSAIPPHAVIRVVAVEFLIEFRQKSGRASAWRARVIQAFMS